MNTIKLGLFLFVCGFCAFSIVFAANPTGVGLRTFATGLAQPIAMAQSTLGDFYVAERGGKIRLLGSSGQFLTDPVFDISAPAFECRWQGQMTPMRMETGGEGGLLNLALDPNFQTNGRIYIYFTTAETIVLARIRVDIGAPTFILPNSCEALMRLPTPPSIHLGGSLAFAADGLLYVGIGNIGQGCEQYVAASQTPFCQTTSVINGVQFNPKAGFLRGKILRFDVNTPLPAGHNLCGVPTLSASLYSTPPENAFGASDKCPEIFAFGLRNPWRTSVDRSTGDFLIGDVGEGAFEELNLLKRTAIGIPAGANLGWPCFEGFRPFASHEFCQNLTLNNTHQPVAVFGYVNDFHTIIGGYRYRGPDSAFDGMYLGADSVNSDRQKIVVARPAVIAPVGQVQPQWSYVPLNSAQLFTVGTPLSYVVSLAQDRVGNLYTLDFNGVIQQFTFNADVEFQSRFE